MPLPTKSTKSVSHTSIQRAWHLIDLKNQTLGRVTNQIAILLQGKHKVQYAPYMDSGDYVVAINAKEIKVTGNKGESKEYNFYSGYPGGLRTVTFNKLVALNPKEVIHHAVSGKLPKNKLRDPRLARLYIFGDANHPYQDKFK